jgi:predicted oxidoreductase
MNEFSRIIAGTMTWGSWGKSFDTQNMQRLMEQCVELGITTFDHADIYGDYSTEEDFGKALSTSSLQREKIQLITKCGIQYPGEKRQLEIKYYDYSKEYIIWSVEESLKNLHTDYIDLLLLHRPSPLMRAEEIADAIDHLRIQGKIKYFGVSNFTSSQTQLVQKYVNVEANQIEFSLSSHGAMLDGALDFMQVDDIKPMAWSPLGSIFRDESEQTLRIRKQLSQLESKYRRIK